MSALTVTAKGQVTLKRELLRHMGVQPGDKIELEVLPHGELRLRASRPEASIESFFSVLDGQRPLSQPLSIEDMNTIAAAGWAGQLAGK